MKKLLISAGALAALALSTPAFAATNNTTTADATVNIVSPLTIQKTFDLNFGTVVGPFAGEQVRVSKASVRTCPATLTCSGNAAVSAAKFDVTGGTGSQALTVTVDPTVTLTGSVSGTLNVDLSTDLPGAISTDSSGNVSFGVGGTLTIPALTADGVYTGTFNVGVDYQ